MENKYIIFLFFGLALIAFGLTVKPIPSIKRFKNLFWVLGNLFYVVGLYFGYIGGHSWEFPAIMLLVANFGVVTYFKKGNS